MNKKLCVFLLCLVFLTACEGAVSNVSDVPEVWKVSNIMYTFDNFDPSKITSIAFDLDHPASSVSVNINNAWFSKKCNSAESFIHWTCQLDAVTVSVDMSMRVEVWK